MGAIHFLATVGYIVSTFSKIENREKIRFR